MPAPMKPEISQDRYQFDRDFLLQYLDQRVKTKVFVDGRFLDISDPSDLESESLGVGYDNAGNPKFFDYRSIEQVKAGSNLITIDQLQQLQNQKQNPSEKEEPEEEEPSDSESPDTGEEPSPEGEEGMPPEGEEEAPPEEEEPGTAEPKPGKGPIKAHYDPYSIGRKIIQESMKKAPSKELHKIVRILEHPYYNVTGVITEVRPDTYEIRPLSGNSGRIEISKEKVKFV